MFLVVHTDLDATLLDHDTYSWEPAQEALSLLREKSIPLILNSSKTLAEMKVISAELDLTYPLVCENGSFIAFPNGGYFSQRTIENHFTNIEKGAGYTLCHLGISRTQFLAKIHQLRENNPLYEFEGYADWDSETISKYTGLPSEMAERSSARNGTEPIHWHGTDEDFQQFKQELTSHELKAVSGGRFTHISGLSDKATGLDELKRLYQATQSNKKIMTIALGDSPNDLGMLNAADIAIVIPNHTTLSPHAPDVIHAKSKGPKGWNESMMEVLHALLNQMESM